MDRDPLECAEGRAAGARPHVLRRVDEVAQYGDCRRATARAAPVEHQLADGGAFAAAVAAAYGGPV